MNTARKIVKEQKKKKARLIKRKKMWLDIQKIMNRVELIFPIIMPLFCMGCVMYLFCFQENKGIASGLDFLIAAMSFAVLVASVIHKKMNDSQKYIYMEPIYLTLLPIVLVVSMVIGVKIEDASVKGRVISFVCLCVTIAFETKEVVSFNHKTNLKKEEEQREKIENIEKESDMNFSVNNKEMKR
ncbi:MAG: hypothetical protein IJO85_11480 [Lachnospiraceae bacterium]|nr:hypothetical protein [Lachnospiraceae bacterium]